MVRPVPKEIVPMVRAAQDAMMDVSMADVVTVAALPSPPPVVVQIVQVVLLVLGLKDNLTWGQMREGMRNNCKNIYKSMIRLTYNLESVRSKATWRRVRALCEDATLHPWLVKRASKEASSLCKWLHAIKGYREMCQVIKREIGIKQVKSYRSTPRLLLGSSLSKKSPRTTKKKTTLKSTPLLSDAEIQEAVNEEFGHARLEALERLTNDGLLAELASYRSPPLIVKRAVHAAFILLDVERLNWTDTRALIVDKAFLRKLSKLTDSCVPLRRVRRFEAYLDKTGLEAESLARASTAAASLIEWADAASEYSRFYRDMKRRILRS